MDNVPSTRDLGRLVTWYIENVRNHPWEERKGVVSSMQRLLKKGFTLEQMETAAHNYANDPYVQRQDQRFRKHIRSFFSQALIEQWQTPTPAKPVNATFSALDKLATLAPVARKPVELDDEDTEPYQMEL